MSSMGQQTRNTGNSMDLIRKVCTYQVCNDGPRAVYPSFRVQKKLVE